MRSGKASVHCSSEQCGAERRAFILLARRAPLVSLLDRALRFVLHRGRLPALLAHRSSHKGRGSLVRCTDNLSQNCGGDEEASEDIEEGRTIGEEIA